MRIRLLPESPLGWTPYAWLIYLSLYVVAALAQADTAWEWIIHSAGLVVFLVLYFRAFWLRGNALLAMAFAIVALGVVLIPINFGASAFFIYGAAFLGDAKRPAVAVRWLAVIVAIVLVEAWLVPLRPQAWVPAAVFSVLIGGTNIHFGELRRRDRALLAAREAAEHLAAIAERERIARDLHDLLGHTLSVIVIKSELAAKLADRDPVRASAEIRDVERISRTALQEVRRAIHGFRGESVEQELATGKASLAAAGVELVTSVGRLDLPPEVERALALGVREALTNVIRHSKATRCEVSAEYRPGTISLIVQDNGIGGSGAEGTGLSGMRTRLAEVGGEVQREGSRGTRLVLTAPRAQALHEKRLPA
jgi:two-component system sensor histidine kinase DesK